MISLNHGLSGILIASVLPLPLAIPVAFLSHFAMDFIPHFGIEGKKRDSSPLYKSIIYADVVAALSLNIPVLAHGRWDMFICGWVAVSPDLSLVHYWFKHGLTLDTSHNRLLKKLHLDFHVERPWLIVPELGLTAVLLMLFIHQL